MEHNIPQEQNEAGEAPVVQTPPAVESKDGFESNDTTMPPPFEENRELIVVYEHGELPAVPPSPIERTINALNNLDFATINLSYVIENPKIQSAIRSIESARTNIYAFLSDEADKAS